MSTVISTFKFKRGTSERWAELNPILDQGEPGYVYDTNRLKIGDGKTAWRDLPYVDGQDCVFNAKTHLEFPSIGSVNTIYKAEEEKKIYQWNPVNLVYEVLSETNLVVDNIELIFGGNANETA